MAGACLKKGKVGAMNAMALDRMAADGTAEDAMGKRRDLALWFPFLPIDRLRIARHDLCAQGEGPAVLVAQASGAQRMAQHAAGDLARGLATGKHGRPAT